MIACLKAKSDQYHQNIQLLEEEYKIQQNMLINHTSKFETLNHLLNQIVVTEDIRKSVNKITNYESPDNINPNKIVNEYIKTDETFINKFKNNIDIKTISPQKNNDSLDSNYSINSSNKKKKKFVYTKLKHFNRNFDNFNNNLILNESHKNTVESKNQENLNADNNEQSKFNLGYEKLETWEKIELESIKCYEYILLDLNKFPLLLLEKLTNGKLDQYNKLSQDYLKAKFSKIIELVKFTRFSQTSSLKTHSSCNESNNSISANNLEREINKSPLSKKYNYSNFKKINFNKNLTNDSKDKYNSIQHNDNVNNWNNSNINNIGIDENFLMDLIIKDLILITNIKYEKIERIINLLIKLNYVNINIKLRENFIFKEYPQNKKFFMDKLLFIEKRIEAKYDKIKTMNFYIRKSESKLNDINKSVSLKKNELNENKNHIKIFEGEINEMKEIENRLKNQIEKFELEKQSLEKDFNIQITDIEKENTKLGLKLVSKNNKLREINEKKNYTISIQRNNENFSIQSSNLRKKDKTLNNENIINKLNDNYEVKKDSSIRNQDYSENEINSNIEEDLKSKNFNHKIKQESYNNELNSFTSYNKFKRKKTNNLGNRGNNYYNNKNNEMHTTSLDDIGKGKNKDNLSFYKFQNFEKDQLNNYSEINTNNNSFNKNYKDRGNINDFKNNNTNGIRMKRTRSKSNKSKVRSDSKNDEIESSKDEFRVNNCIYTKNKYPAENTNKKNTNISFDSSGMNSNSPLKDLKKHYIFEKRFGNKKENSIPRNNKSSFSSKKIRNDSSDNNLKYLENYNSTTKNLKIRRLKNENFKTIDRNEKNLENNSNNKFEKRKIYSDSINRKVNSSMRSKENEISNEYIDPELQLRLNDKRFEEKYKTYREKSRNENESFKKGSEINLLRRSQTKKFIQDEKKCSYFENMSNRRNINNFKPNKDNRKPYISNIDTKFYNPQNQKYYQNISSEKDHDNKNINLNFHFSKNLMDNKLDNIPNTCLRTNRNPSNINLVSKNDISLRNDKDKSRYLITKSNEDEENEKNFNIKEDLDKNTYKKNYYKESYPNKNEIYCSFNKKNNFNEFKNENYNNKIFNNSIEYSQSNSSTGAAYLNNNKQCNKNKEGISNDKYNKKSREEESNPKHKRNLSLYSLKDLNINYNNDLIDKPIELSNIHYSQRNNVSSDSISLNNNSRYTKNTNIITKNLVEETKKIFYGNKNNSNKKLYDERVENEKIKITKSPDIPKSFSRNLIKNNSNDIKNLSFNTMNKNNNSIINTTAGSHYMDNFSNKNFNQNNIDFISNLNINILDNSTKKFSNTSKYEISNIKNYHKNENRNILHKNNQIDIPRSETNFNNNKNDKRKMKKINNDDIRKIDLLSLNYNYQTTTQNTNSNINDSTIQSEKNKINYTENLIKHFRNNNKNNNANTNRFNIYNDSFSYRQNEEINGNNISSFINDSGYINFNENFFKFGNDDLIMNNYNKIINKDTNSNFPNSKKNNNGPEILINPVLEFSTFNAKIFHLEQGCVIYKRNNYFGSKFAKKINSNIFYSSEFNPLDYGFKKYFCNFDSKRNKINFSKEDNISDKKISDVYLASLTSYKVPQYTKNLVFIKQLYRKFLNNFDSIENMDDYITKNTHFLVNLYYKNCKEEEIKFDNRLYSKEFRRELLNNNNFIIYLNLLSDDTRIEMMFIEYDDFKNWINGLQELLSLKNF